MVMTRHVAATALLKREWGQRELKSEPTNVGAANLTQPKCKDELAALAPCSGDVAPAPSTRYSLSRPSSLSLVHFVQP